MSTLVQFASVLIGVVSTLFIYSLDDFKSYGFSQALLAAAIIITPFATLGAAGLVTRFFPVFRADPRQRAAFFTLLLLVGTAGCVFIGLLGYFGLLPLLIAGTSSTNNVELYVEYARPIYYLVVILVFSALFDTYIQNFHRITVQTILLNFVPKLLLPLLIYLGYYYRLPFEVIAYGLVVMQGIVLVLLIGYLYHLGNLRFSLQFSDFPSGIWKQMATYAAYGIIGALSGKIALEIDTVSLGAFTDEETVGIYRVIIFAALVIAAPLNAVTKIASPIITQSLADNNLVEVEKIYRRSAVLLNMVGLVLFTLILVSLDDIFALTGKQPLFVGGTLTFVLLAGAQLLDLTSSVNSQIIAYSKFYRFNLVVITLLAFLNVWLNWLFIASWQMGIIGAALATFLAVLIFNLAKGLFILLKFRIHPLERSLLFPLLLSVACALLLQQFNLTFHPVINIGVRSVVVGSVFLGYLWFTPYLPELKGIFIQLLNRLGIGLK